MQLEMASDGCKYFTSELILEYFRAYQIFDTVLYFLRQNQSPTFPFSRYIDREKEGEKDIIYVYM